MIIAEQTFKQSSFIKHEQSYFKQPSIPLPTRMQAPLAHKRRIKRHLELRGHRRSKPFFSFNLLRFLHNISQSHCFASLQQVQMHSFLTTSELMIRCLSVRYFDKAPVDYWVEVDPLAGFELFADGGKEFCLFFALLLLFATLLLLGLLAEARPFTLGFVDRIERFAIGIVSSGFLWGSWLFYFLWV